VDEMDDVADEDDANDDDTDLLLDRVEERDEEFAAEST